MEAVQFAAAHGALAMAPAEVSVTHGRPLLIGQPKLSTTHCRALLVGSIQHAPRTGESRARNCAGHDTRRILRKPC